MSTQSTEDLRVFLSHAREDREPAAELYGRLKRNGFRPWMDEKDLLPGQPWRTAIAKAIRQADVFLVLLSQHSTSKRGFVQKEIRLGIEIWEERPEGDVFLIPVLLESTEIPERLREIHPVYLYEEDGFRRLIHSLRVLEGRRETGDELADSRRNLTITRVELTDIRCFEQLDLRFEQGGEAVLTTMVLGDNGAGKSTLLRSIALGLCNESDAVALIKEVPGGFVRSGAQEGKIEISLEDAERGDVFTIVTRIVKTNGQADEVVRKASRPADDFPWDQVFVCGYGAQRANQAVTSHDEYSIRDAVLSLFDDGASLQTPELVLLRRPPDLRADIERRLLEVLMLDDPEFEVSYPKSGLEIRGPWGRQPLPALSDGYRSTTQWLLDFIAWLIYADRFMGHLSIGGVLLIDELEQHLHPRWQRHIVQRLRKQFPRTQIIASTHTPLVAAGASDVENSMLLRLTRGGGVTSLDKASIAGKRADQILASEAFGLVTTRSPDSQHEISRYAELLGAHPRNDEQDAELRELKERIVEALSWGENDFERTVEKAVGQALETLVLKAPRELIDLEARRQLREIFKDEKAP